MSKPLLGERGGVCCLIIQLERQELHTKQIPIPCCTYVLGLAEVRLSIKTSLREMSNVIGECDVVDVVVTAIFNSKPNTDLPFDCRRAPVNKLAVAQRLHNV